MRIEFKQSYFLIEGEGKAKEIIESWLKEWMAAQERTIAFVKEIGAINHTRCEETGILTGIVFDKGQVPDGWIKPNNRGITRPKKGTDLYKRFKAQKGCEKFSPIFAKAFNIPTTMWPTDAEGKKCRVEMGHWFTPCQLVSTGKQHGVIIPNVAYYVAKAEAEGLTVPEDVKAFKPEFEGCRQITREDWELIEIQHRASKATTV